MALFISRFGTLGRYRQLSEINWKLIYLGPPRPDIAYFTDHLSTPTSHLQTAHRILQYLKGTTGAGLALKHQGKLSLEIYTNTNFSRSTNDHRPTTLFLLLNPGQELGIHGGARNREVVSRSSTEAEYQAMVHGICKAICTS